MADTFDELLLELGAVAVTALGEGDHPVIDPAVVYHGTPPNEAECSNGLVTVWWAGIAGGDRFPSASPVFDCGSPPMVDVTVRWTLCWPIEPTRTPAKTAEAVTLANGALAVTLAYMNLVCQRAAALPEVARRGLALVSVTPRRPMGGVAGVDWKLRVRPVFPAAAE